MGLAGLAGFVHVSGPSLVPTELGRSSVLSVVHSTKLYTGQTAGPEMVPVS